MKTRIVFLWSLVVPLYASSQAIESLNPQKTPANLTDVQRSGTAAQTVDYLLGPGDQISVSVAGLDEEYSQKAFRINSGGDVTLPSVGRIHASGLTTFGLENELCVRLRGVLKNPQAIVTVTTFGSQPVSVLGAVKSPGIVQLEGRKSLFEVLSMAGGLQPDAGYVVQITRPLSNGPIPVPTNTTDTKDQVSVASIRLRDIINAPQARENIQILPGDAISVPRAGVVYVIGAVAKPGGFPLNENESVSALQALSLAEGMQSISAPSRARILRATPGNNNRTDLHINLSRVLSGAAPDVQLHADDILFVPTSRAKQTGIRAIDAIINASTYASVYAR